MSEEAAAPTGGEATTIVTAGADAPATMSAGDAARMLAEQRWKRNQPAESAEPAQAATAEPELSGEDNAAPQDEATGETQEAAPADVPPRELPRSWTKEQNEHWTKLDPAIQDFLIEQDRKASAEVRRSQNEAAEARKAADAELARWKTERETYVSKQTTYTQALENTLQAEFGDITSMNDVRKMQAEDPFRFQQWQLRQMELAQAKAEQSANEQRASDERRASWQKFARDESEAFEKEVPEFAEKKDEYTKKAADVLTEIGFSGEELGKLASGEEKISLYDRRMQRLLFDRIKLSEIKAAVPKAVPKTLPPVQKPGAARAPGAAAATRAEASLEKLTQTGLLNDGVAALLARRAAARRAS